MNSTSKAGLRNSSNFLIMISMLSTIMMMEYFGSIGIQLCSKIRLIFLIGRNFSAVHYAWNPKNFPNQQVVHGRINGNKSVNSGRIRLSLPSFIVDLLASLEHLRWTQGLTPPIPSTNCQSSPLFTRQSTFFSTSTSQRKEPKMR